MDNSPQIELIDAKKKSPRKDGKSSKYRMGEGERRLPRPVVFWSDNEKDAFRRNKIVQTRYNMLMDDIENQKKTIQKTHRHEAHKYHVRSGRIRQECQRIQNEVTEESEETKNIPEPDANKGSGEDSDWENQSDSDSEGKHEKSGIITKHKRPSVKFSVYKEYIPHEDKSSPVERRSPCEFSSAKRSLSASATFRKAPDLPGSIDKRAHSTIPAVHAAVLEDKERPKSSPASSKNNKCSNQKKFHKPNKLFFDKSIAAYELRKELQKLARLRKQGSVSTSYTVVDALRDERERYEASQARVSQYLQRLEAEARNDDVTNQWKEVDHGIA